jgi:hypothetical protein
MSQGLKRYGTGSHHGLLAPVERAGAPGGVGSRSSESRANVQAKIRAQLLTPVLRWTPGRKQRLIAAIAAGIVTAADVCGAHDLSPAEIEAWQAAYRRGGPKALRVYPKTRA